MSISWRWLVWAPFRNLIADARPGAQPNRPFRGAAVARKMLKTSHCPLTTHELALTLTPTRLPRGPIALPLSTEKPMPRNNCSARWFACASLLVVMAAIPAVSRAQTCASNADCTAGLTCQLSAVPPQPTAGPDCVKGQACTGTAPAGGVSTATPVQNVTTCQVAPCTVDSDCGAAGMVCHAEKAVSCSAAGATCPANTACDVTTMPAPPESCTETTVSTCAFKWQLPCNTDQDCGSEFVCNPSVSGTCSSGVGVAGSGGTASGGSGTAPVGGQRWSSGVAVAPHVRRGYADLQRRWHHLHHHHQFPGYCRPKAISCVVDTDCPAAWSCVTPPTPRPAGRRPWPRRAPVPPAPANVAEVPVGPKLCQPPVSTRYAAVAAPGSRRTSATGPPPLAVMELASLRW